VCVFVEDEIGELENTLVIHAGTVPAASKTTL
jgi:hypothetical protein